MKKPRIDPADLSVPKVQLGKYRHYRGDIYELVGAGLDTETMEEVVIYKPLSYDTVPFWVRPLAMFFEDVEVEGKIVKRFEKIDD